MWETKNPLCFVYMCFNLIGNIVHNPVEKFYREWGEILPEFM